MTTNSRKQPVPRAGFDALSVYDGAAGACAIDLSDNTNLWGMPPSAIRALESFRFDSATRYPAPYTADLKKSLADYTGVDPATIVTGCGSDDVLDASIRAFGNPGGVLACCDPTFSMIPVLARLNGLSVIQAPYSSDGDLPVQSLLEANADIIYICSPNNPTGSSASRDRVEIIVKAFSGLVIIDQAYAEYSQNSLLDMALTYDNVLVTRTLSKAFGMAGLRVGYAIGSRNIVDEVEKSRGPYKVGALSSAAAIAAVDNDIAWIEEVVRETAANRSRLVDRLEDLGLAPLPSDANFLLVPVSDAGEVSGRLAVNGIAVRAFRNLPGIGDAIRITVGPWSMMEQFLSVFEQK